MTLEEAVKLWVTRDFSNIPTVLIKKAFKNNYDELELLSSEFPQLDYPAGWEYMFHPECLLDEEWITDNIEEVEECGFLVYYSEETGILLGVDGCGYDFYSSHWIPLYKKRGLRWHKEEAVEEVLTVSS
jgi:hypothetical protein